MAQSSIEITVSPEAKQFLADLSALVDQMVGTKPANNAEMERLMEGAIAELTQEQRAHDQIASMCFAAGVETSDGTSISAVKNLVAELEQTRAALEKEQIGALTAPEIMYSAFWELVGKPASHTEIIGGKEYTSYDGPLTTVRKMVDDLTRLRHVGGLAMQLLDALRLDCAVGDALTEEERGLYRHVAEELRAALKPPEGGCTAS